MNLAMIIGNLGREPELKYTQNGTAVCNLQVASNEQFGDKKITTWIPVIAWKGLAEAVAKYCKKGSLIFAMGSERERQWTGNDGTTRYVRELHAQRIKFLDKTKGNQAADAGPIDADLPDEGEEILDDDIPF